MWRDKIYWLAGCRASKQEGEGERESDETLAPGRDLAVNSKKAEAAEGKGLVLIVWGRKPQQLLFLCFYTTGVQTLARWPNLACVLKRFQLIVWCSVHLYTIAPWLFCFLIERIKGTQERMDLQLHRWVQCSKNRVKLCPVGHIWCKESLYLAHEPIAKSLLELTCCYYIALVPLTLQIPECSAGILGHQLRQDVHIRILFL